MNTYPYHTGCSGRCMHPHRRHWAQHEGVSSMATSTYVCDDCLEGVACGDASGGVCGAVCCICTPSRCVCVMCGVCVVYVYVYYVVHVMLCVYFCQHVVPDTPDTTPLLSSTPHTPHPAHTTTGCGSGQPQQEMYALHSTLIHWAQHGGAPRPPQPPVKLGSSAISSDIETLGGDTHGTTDGVWWILVWLHVCMVHACTCVVSRDIVVCVAVGIYFFL